jgi:Tol biopolymer transport system component
MPAKNARPSANASIRRPPPTFQRIVYVHTDTPGNLGYSDTADGEIYVMNRDGSEATRLGAAGMHNREPALSPNLQRIAYVSGDFNIYTMGLDGTDLVRLTTGGVSRLPKWSPDGRRIAFVMGGRIHIMAADGSNISPFAPPISTVDPCWSPDGTNIAYVVPVPDTDPRDSRIHVWSLAANRDRVLTWGTRPAWSPDGSKIAFVGDHDQIYVINSDGTGTPNQLTFRRYVGYPYWDSWPTWSPDGTRIAFQRYFEQADPPYGRTNIFSVDAAVGDEGQFYPGQLTNHNYYSGQPNWAESAFILDPPK